MGDCYAVRVLYNKMYTHINVPATVLERLKSGEPGGDGMDLGAKNLFKGPFFGIFREHTIWTRRCDFVLRNKK